MDNCIKVDLRIEGTEMWFNRTAMDKIKTLYPPGQKLLAHIQYLHWGVFSLSVTTIDNKVLTPKTEDALFSGRVLPLQIQDLIKEEYGVIFRPNRLRSQHFKPRRSLLEKGQHVKLQAHFIFEKRAKIGRWHSFTPLGKLTCYIRKVSFGNVESKSKRQASQTIKPEKAKI
ncbi:hypothetical protein PIB30_080624 [Stylosanthes scabra]|uniref:Uncharacterized protein n=2 Tax=Stylosanthes scabra TaxID=79078 RepID=A0ABU6TS28_9FABA|nr:hypothetical protein [Stylosanthes scabra]